MSGHSKHKIQIIRESSFSQSITSIGWFLIWVLSMVLTTGLGFWQLARARQSEKREYQYQAAVLSAPSGQWTDLTEIQHIQLQGRWLDWTGLMPHRRHQDRLGAQVFGVFEHQGQLFMVDRGWLAGHEWPPRGQQHRVLGVWEPIHKKNPWINPSMVEKKSYFEVYQPDAAYLSTVFGKKMQAGVLHLSAGQPDTFLPIWKLNPHRSRRHWAYTFQWWIFTAILCVGGYMRLKH